MRSLAVGLASALLVGAANAAPIIGLELEGGQVVARNMSTDPIRLAGAQLNLREDCYLFAVTNGGGPIGLWTEETIGNERAAPGGEDLTIWPGDVTLRLGEGIPLRWDRTACSEAGSAVVQVRIILREGEYGSYVDFPIPPGGLR